jgi:hypothetical protein
MIEDFSNSAGRITGGVITENTPLFSLNFQVRKCNATGN